MAKFESLKVQMLSLVVTLQEKSSKGVLCKNNEMQSTISKFSAKVNSAKSYQALSIAYTELISSFSAVCDDILAD
jgi:hypothetical protein